MNYPLEYQALGHLEALIYKEFPTSAPNKGTLLIETRNHTKGFETHRNDDEQEIEEFLNWRPWPEIIGYRLATLDPISIRISLSVSALHYYLPAFLLTSIYLRSEPLGMIGEIIELLLPPEHDQIRSALSGYGVCSQQGDALFILRFNEFVSHFTPPQKKVCAEFLRVWYPLRRGGLDTGTQVAFDELLAFWT